MTDVNKKVGVKFNVTGLEKQEGFSKLLKNLESAKKGVDSLQKSLSSLKVNPEIGRLSDALSSFSKIRLTNIRTVANSFKALEKIKLPPNLSKLTDDLRKLETVKAPNFEPFITSINKLSKASNDVRGSITTITTLKTTLDEFKNIRIPNLTGLVKSIERFGKISLGDFPSRIRNLVTVLQQFQVVKLPNLSNFVSGLKKLENIDISAISNKVKSLNASLNNLAKAGYLNTFTKFASTLHILSNSLTNTTAKLQQASSAVNNFANKTKNSGSRIATFGAKIKTLFDFRLISAGLQTARDALYGFVSAVGVFDQSLKNLQAITKATESEMSLLSKGLLDIASDSKYTAAEIANAATIIGQAGFSAAESLEIVDDVATLATGTLSDIPTVVDLVTTTLRVFRLEAEQTTEVIDIFANAVNGSKLTIEKLSVAVSYVGPVARASGVSLKEMTAAMAVLADAGLRSSKIGTGLRRVFAEMVAPAKKLREAIYEAGLSLSDINPNAVGFTQSLENLRLIVQNSTDAFNLFGKRGALAIIELTNSEERLQQLIDTLDASGSAAEMAAIQMEGLVNKFEKLRGKLANFSVALGNAGPRKALSVLLDLLNGLLDIAIDFAETGLGKVITSLTTFAAVTVSVITAVGALAFAFKGLKIVLAAGLKALGLISIGFWPLIGVITAVAAAITAFGLLFSDTFREAVGSIKLFGVSIKTYFESFIAYVLAFVGKFQVVIEIWELFKEAATFALGTILKSVATFFLKLLDFAGKIPGLKIFASWVDGATELRQKLLDVQKAGDEMAKNSIRNARDIEAAYRGNTKALDDQAKLKKKLVDEERENSRLAEGYEEAYEIIRESLKKTAEIAKEVNAEFAKQKTAISDALEAAITKLSDLENEYLESVDNISSAFEDFGDTVEAVFDGIWERALSNNVIQGYENQLEELKKLTVESGFETEQEIQAISKQLGDARIDAAKTTFQKAAAVFDGYEERINLFFATQRKAITGNDQQILAAQRELASRQLALTQKVTDARLKQATKYTDVLKAELDKAVAEEEKYGKRVQELADKRADLAISRQDDLNAIRRQGLSEYRKAIDIEREATEYLNSALKDLNATDAEKEQRLLKSIDLYKSLSDEQVNGARKTQLLEKAYSALDNVYKEQEKSAEELRKTNSELVTDRQKELSETLEDIKNLKAELQGGLEATFTLAVDDLDTQLTNFINDTDAVIKTRLEITDLTKQLDDIDAKITAAINDRKEKLYIDLYAKLDTEALISEVAGLKEKMKEEIDIALVDNGGKLNDIQKRMAEIIGYTEVLKDPLSVKTEISRKTKEDITELNDGLGKVLTQKKELDEITPVKLNIDTDPVRNAISATEEMQRTYVALRKDAEKGFEVVAKTDPAVKAIRELLAELAKVKDKKITVDAEIRQTNSTSSNSSAEGFRTGGRLGNGYGGGDRIPVLAEAGEWVIRKEAVRFFGNDFMKAVNSLRVPRFRTGGAVNAVSTAATVPSTTIFSGLSDFGKVNIDLGKVKFPAIVKANVLDELNQFVLRNELMGVN